MMRACGSTIRTSSAAITHISITERNHCGVKGGGGALLTLSCFCIAIAYKNYKNCSIISGERYSPLILKISMVGNRLHAYNDIMSKRVLLFHV